MTDILENTTSPLAETAAPAVAQESGATPDSAPLHGLSHLEAEFVAVWATFEGDAKKTLAWIAAKL
jgi:hypothetical protein